VLPTNVLPAFVLFIIITMLSLSLEVCFHVSRCLHWQVADIVAARARLGKNYGVVLIPEGLLEHVPEVTAHAV